MIAPQLIQWVLALLPSSPLWGASWGVEHPIRSQTAFNNSPKSVVIIGAGSAGLASLQAILQLPEETRAGWNVVAYEQRNGIGGVWLADPNEPPKPPALPETPLYPALHTNTPVPVMTFPNSPFPPGTPMYPSYHHIQRYHEEYARKEGLIPHIRLEHEVVSAIWTGTPSEGSWNITIRHHNTLQFQHADHLIVGNGHNHYPHYPHLEGIQDWLATDKFREVSHSIYYRRPNQYSNRTILVIGGGASGRDIARQAAPFSTRTYQSLRPGNIDNGTAGGDVIPVPAVVALNRTSVLLADGSALHDIQSIVFATGYDLRIPFLSAPHSDALREIPVEARSPNSESASQLTTNTRYLFPLHEHIFSLSPELPTTALAFIGLPIGVANCFSDSSQALYMAHTISDPSILASRDELVQNLVKEERRLATLGHDVYNKGHRLTAWSTHSVDYQNRLVEVLRAKGKLPAGPPFTEPWRANSWHRPRLGFLVRAWERVKAQGEEAIQRWVGEARTDEDWAAVMDALIEWQEEHERVHGGRSVLEQTMDGVDEWWEY